MSRTIKQPRIKAKHKDFRFKDEEEYRLYSGNKQYKNKRNFVKFQEFEE